MELISMWLKEESVEELSGTARAALDGFTSRAAEYLQSIKLRGSDLQTLPPLWERLSSDRKETEVNRTNLLL